MSFDAFIQGLQGGMRTMQDIRRGRQLEKLGDAALTRENAEVDRENYNREDAGLNPFEKIASSNPFLFRWMEKLGRGTGTTESPTAGVLPTTEELPAEETPYSPEEFAGYADEGMSFADGKRPIDELGGFLDEDEKKSTRERASARRSSSRGIPEPDVRGDPSRYKPAAEGQVGNAERAASRIPKYEGVGLASKAGEGLIKRGAKALGRAAIPLTIASAGAHGAYRGYNADVPDRHADGPESDRMSRVKDAVHDTGYRALAAGRGVLEGLGLVGAPEGAAAAPAAAPEAVLPGTSSGPTGRSRVTGVGRPGAPAAPGAPAPAAAPQGAIQQAAQDPLDSFDISKFSASDVPNFSAKDWEAHRDKMIKSLVNNGMSYAEAWDKVDQSVTATQQRGFTHFANQAIAALQMGDKKHAGTAIRAAFQHMPTTTDIEVGEYNGHLVAFPVDEETGQQEGTPVVVTPQLLQDIAANFANPQNWNEVAMDRRKLDQADTELGLKERQLGQADRGLDIEQQRANAGDVSAQADVIRAGRSGGGGEGAFKFSDADRQTQLFQDAGFQLGGDDDELAGAISAVLSARYAEVQGSTRPEVLIEALRAKAATPEGRAQIKQVAAAYGQR